VDLIALFDVVEEEMRVGHGEDHFFHSITELGGHVWILVEKF
jgi:hypothetical protein